MRADQLDSLSDAIQGSGDQPGESAGLLWAKGLPLDSAIHAFTVDEDAALDRVLLPWDAIGSAAHVRMLEACELLRPGDARSLLKALHALHEEALDDRFDIRPEQEDGHTALEQALIARVGEAGRRIHLGRSRNDQVILALRLYLRQELLAIGRSLATLAASFVRFAGQHVDQPMPGYTHMRRAMPSTVAQWSLSFAEGLTEELEALQAVYRRLDRCPLGAAAGFGVPLPIDREYTSRLLGFRRVQRNPVDVNNSRGRHELALLQWLASAAGVLEKYLQDLALFSTEEFGFFTLPDAFTTGSSIMPQKRNPDVVELARGRCRELRGLAGQLEHLAAMPGSSYHRDSQLMKAPVLRATSRGRALLDVLVRLVPAVEVRPDRLAEACDDKLYAAHEACRRAADGQPFRDVYAEVAGEILDGRFRPDRSALRGNHTGSVGCPGLSACDAEIAGHDEWIRRMIERLDGHVTELWVTE